MMLYPSIMKLMEKTGSRYSLVIATAKRARQIISGSEPMNEKKTCPKALSIAVEEVFESKVKII